MELLLINYGNPFTGSAHTICLRNLVCGLLDHDCPEPVRIHWLALNVRVTRGDGSAEAKQHYLEKYGDRITYNEFRRIINKPSLFGSPVEWLRSGWIVRRYIKKHRLDRALAYGETALFTLWAVSSGRNIKIMLDSKGNFIYEEEHNRNVGKVRLWAEQRMLRKLLHRVDTVFISSSRLKKAFTLYGSSVRFIMNTNYYYDRLFNTNSPRDRGTTGLVFIYSGGIQKYQSIEKTLALFRAYLGRHPGSRLILIIKGDRVKIERMLKDQAIDTSAVTLMDNLPLSEINTWLNKADMALMLRNDSLQNYYAFRTKFPEYLAAGLPVITTEYPSDTRDIIEQNKLGVFIDMYGDLEKEVTKIDRFMAENPDIHERCAEYAKKHMSWAANVERIYQEIFCGA